MRSCDDTGIYGMQRRWSGQSGPEADAALPELTRGFSWSFRGRRQQLRIRIPMWLHGYYLSRPRSSDYGVYIADPFDDPIVSAIASHVSKYAHRNRLTDLETIEFAATFVHGLEYVPDDVSTSYDNYPRYPIETLVHRGGDCEDASVLLASVLRSLGYDVGLILLPGHLQVGVVRDGSLPGAYYEYDEKRYYVLEATGGGWTLGEMPSEYQEVAGEVIPTTGTPVLVHRWSATMSRDEITRGTVSVTNLGNAAGTSARGLLQFRTETGDVLGAKHWSHRKLPAGETESIEFELDVETTGEMRGRVKLFLGGDLHDESTSEAVTVERE